MKTIYLIAILLTILSCQTQIKNEGEPEDNTGIPTAGDSSRSSHLLSEETNKIEDLDSDSCSIHWYGGGIFSLCFEPGQVTYFFSPQCICTFDTKIKKNKIVVYYKYTENCTFDRGFKKKYGVKSYPQPGAAFGEFVLLNDSVLRASYYYAEWINKINTETKDIDTLFPTVFKRKKR